MADAIEIGTREVADAMNVPPTSFEIIRRRAAEATARDLLTADGFLFCAPENLASVSGEMKEFFDRTYYDMFQTADDSGAAGRGESEASTEETSLLLGRPFGLAIAAGSDGYGAARQVERICRGWRLRPVAETLVERNGLPQTKGSILVEKTCSAGTLARCRELGGIVAATVLL